MTIMMARLAWAMDIKLPVDEAGKEVKLRIEYEPTPNARPYPFPAKLTPRSKERLQFLKREVEETRRVDPLAE